MAYMVIGHHRLEKQMLDSRVKRILCELGAGAGSAVVFAAVLVLGYLWAVTG